jgi:hypothetical protein
VRRAGRCAAVILGGFLMAPAVASGSFAWQPADALLPPDSTMVSDRDRLVVAPDGTAIALVAEQDATGDSRYVLDSKAPGAPVQRRVLTEDRFGVLYGDLAVSATGEAIAVWPDLGAGGNFVAVRPPHGSFGPSIRISDMTWQAKVAMNDRGDAALFLYSGGGNAGDPATVEVIPRPAGGSFGAAHELFEPAQSARMPDWGVALTNDGTAAAYAIEYRPPYESLSDLLVARQPLLGGASDSQRLSPPDGHVADASLAAGPRSELAITWLAGPQGAMGVDNSSGRLARALPGQGFGDPETFPGFIWAAGFTAGDGLVLGAETMPDTYPPDRPTPNAVIVPFNNGLNFQVLSGPADGPIGEPVTVARDFGASGLVAVSPSGRAVFGWTSDSYDPTGARWAESAHGSIGGTWRRTGELLPDCAVSGLQLLAMSATGQAAALVGGGKRVQSDEDWHALSLVLDADGPTDPERACGLGEPTGPAPTAPPAGVQIVPRRAGLRVSIGRIVIRGTGARRRLAVPVRCSVACRLRLRATVRGRRVERRVTPRSGRWVTSHVTLRARHRARVVVLAVAGNARGDVAMATRRARL